MHTIIFQKSAKFFTDAVVAVEGTVQNINLTQSIGSFLPTYLPYMTKLQSIDISGCHTIDTVMFVDCIYACQNLMEIIMISCYDFTESQMVKILSNLPKLEIVDCTHATKLTFCDTFTIVSSLHALRNINVEPKYPKWELKTGNALYTHSTM